MFLKLKNFFISKYFRTVLDIISKLYLTNVSNLRFVLFQMKFAAAEKPFINYPSKFEKLSVLTFI